MAQYMNFTSDDAERLGLQYNGTWSHLTFNQNPVPVYHATLSQCTEAGCSMWFGSPVVQVWVYGSVVPRVAGGPPTTADFALTPYDTPGKPTASGTFVAPSVPEQQYNVLFWNSGVIPWQGVWFTINVTSASVDTPFLLDYFIYTEQTESPPTVLPTTTTLTNGLPLSTAANSSSALPTQSGEPEVAQTTASPSNTGAIVGGVVGGVLLVAAILVILFLWCRKRQTAVKNAPSPREPTIRAIRLPSGIDGVTPYMVPRDHNTTSAAVVPPERAGPITAARAGIPVMASISKARPSNPSSTPGWSGTATASSSSFSPQGLPVQQASTSQGRRPLGSMDVQQEFPPSYTAS